jgi:hypothetical protein
MSGSPPLRFVGVVVGGWVCARAAVLAPDLLTEEVRANESAPAAEPAFAEAEVVPAPEGSPPAAILPVLQRPSSGLRILEASKEKAQRIRLAVSTTTGRLAVVPPIEPPASPLPPEAPPSIEPAQPIAAALDAQPSRLSVSGWALVREGSGRQLAAGGVLGGSQAGVRATYRLERSLALSARLSSPLQGDGAEAALGVEWQPVPEVPVKLLAERRQAIGEEGRSAFAVMAHGGVSKVRVAGPVEMDAYAQAGVVGARERDGFVDGAVKLGVPVGSGVSVGAGAWGAAQPGVSRLDVGPQVTVELPGGGINLRVSAEWRVRVAGDAEPGSGPALTVGTGF